jgi:AcrR family transcriptional regulator
VNPHSSDDRTTQRLRDRFREETGRAVLFAAEQVFSEQGFFGASMAQIAERAGVAVGTLYNHFEDRETLLGALLDQRSDELLEQLDRLFASTGKLPFAEQLRGFVETLLNHFETHRALLNCSFSDRHTARSLRPGSNPAESGAPAKDPATGPGALLRRTVARRHSSYVHARQDGCAAARSKTGGGRGNGVFFARSRALKWSLQRTTQGSSPRPPPRDGPSTNG